jgi:hypothetical protein
MPQPQIPARLPSITVAGALPNSFGVGGLLDLTGSPPPDPISLPSCFRGLAGVRGRAVSRSRAGERSPAECGSPNEIALFVDATGDVSKLNGEGAPHRIGWEFAGLR